MLCMCSIKSCSPNLVSLRDFVLEVVEISLKDLILKNVNLPDKLLSFECFLLRHWPSNAKSKVNKVLFVCTMLYVLDWKKILRVQSLLPLCSALFCVKISSFLS